MRYRLRTLLIVLALGPMALAPVLFWGWSAYQRRLADLEKRRVYEMLDSLLGTPNSPPTAKTAPLPPD
jgi:hypothetical protein